MRRARQLAAWCGVVVFAAIGGPAARAWAADRPLLAHAAGDALWVATVGPRPPSPVAGPLASSPTVAGPAEQTQVLVRRSLPGKTWRLLAVIPGRATSIAARDSQLAVLLADGQWLTVWADGTASGQPLPADGQIRALADDGQALWAVGSVNGGLARADAELAKLAAATRPTYPTPALTTRPSTGPAVEPDVAGGPTRLVLFRQVDGRWAADAELPDVPPTVTADDLSVAVVNRTPTVAYRSADGAVHTLRGRPDGRTWDPVGLVRPDPAHPVAAFQLLADAATGPLLWTTTGGTDPGQVRAAGPDAVPRPLRWAGPPPLDGLSAAAIAGGYLRVIGPSGSKTVEQRYQLTGNPVGTPAEVFVPPEPGDSALLLWVQGLLLASLAFTIGTSVYRQVTPGGAVAAGSPSTAAEADAAVAPAPLGARAAAGGIDLLPLALGVLAALVVAARHPGEAAPAAAVWAVVVAAVVYLAHTTALEALTARSVGKWLTGLRVATPDGGRPAVWQLVARNLLRVLDPLVWIVLSPLRQRTADVLAGTVVVRDVHPAAASAPPEDPA